MGPSLDVNRPRNVDWKRAAALLYGDWGTSKAYVIGLAFAAAGFASLTIIVAVSLLTAVVGYNYAIVCRSFPDGGGVYSAAREQSRLLAAVGALLLIANFLVTAALSGWAAMSYFGVPTQIVVPVTAVTIALVGCVNFFGPKHSGSMSIAMAIPTAIIVLIIVAISIGHLHTGSLEAPGGFGKTWVSFVKVILALSGVEAIANMTGVMKLDPGSTAAQPSIRKTASKSILIVAVEVVLGTVLLGWAMLSLPRSYAPELLQHKEDMLRFLGQHYMTDFANPAMGSVFGWIVGLVFGVLLLSAVNTAVVAVIGVIYMMALDGEFPRPLTRLNRYGVPWMPLLLGTVLPIVILFVTKDSFDTLADLYAIGVVGAIAVNLGSCTVNPKLAVRWWERVLMGATFLVLAAVWLTTAYTVSHALFFAICVVGAGLGLRAYSHKLTGLKTLTLSTEVAELVTPEAIEKLRPRCVEGQKVMVAARGPTPVLKFALEYAAMKKATLCVLYVKEVAVFLGATPTGGGRSRWQDDPHAAAIMSQCLKLGEELGVPVLPVYAVSTEPAATILDSAATLGVDYLMLGASQRLSLARLLKGNVIDQVACGLPEDIQLIIHG